MQKTIKLSNGYSIPTLGLGTWKSEPNKVGAAVKYAIEEAGYTHIDGASIYRNEKEIGKVYAEIFKTIKREDIFITSKLWNTNHDPVHVEQACKKSLHDLQLDYLDLYLMHWGIAFKYGSDLTRLILGKAQIVDIPIRDTWEAMENLVKLGFVKSIGVANFSVAMLDSLLTSAHIPPVINQVEIHPYNSQLPMLKFCAQKKIVVTAYSPLGRQGVATIKGPRLFTDPVIVELSNKYTRPASQIILNWALGRGTVAIPKSVTPERIKENIGAYDFTLTQADMVKIDALNKDLRFVDPSADWGVSYFKS